MRLMTFIAATLLLFACGSKKNAEGKSKKEKKTEQGMDVIKATASVGQYSKSNDPIMSIDTLFITGNMMYLDVTFGGGCQEHTFELIGSASIAKSYPPIRGVQIVHQANNDMCKAIVRKRIEVNIEELAYKKEQGSEIYLSVEGWNDRVLYKYQSK